MRVGLLHSRIRVEEKLLLTQFGECGVDVTYLTIQSGHYLGYVAPVAAGL